MGVIDCVVSCQHFHCDCADKRERGSARLWTTLRRVGRGLCFHGHGYRSAWQNASLARPLTWGHSCPPICTTKYAHALHLPVLEGGGKWERAATFTVNCSQFTLDLDIAPGNREQSAVRDRDLPVTLVEKAGRPGGKAGKGAWEEVGSTDRTMADARGAGWGFLNTKQLM